MGGGGIVDETRARLGQDGWERELEISVGSSIVAAYVLARVLGVR
jgi:hypothetical protein